MITYIQKLWQKIMMILFIDYITRQKHRENCWKFLMRARMWNHNRIVKRVKDALDKTKRTLHYTKKDAQEWHNAWHSQGELVGIAYWNGFSNGKKTAISWHLKEAEQRRNAAKGFASEADKNYSELDARFHEYSAEKIDKQNDVSQHSSSWNEEPVRICLQGVERLLDLYKYYSSDEHKLLIKFPCSYDRMHGGIADPLMKDYLKAKTPVFPVKKS